MARRARQLPLVCAPVFLCWVTSGFTTSTGHDKTVAAELALDLSASEADDWILLDKTAQIQAGELILDGRRKRSRAIFKPQEWENVALQASFLGEPQDNGVLACGFIVRTVDGADD